MNSQEQRIKVEIPTSEKHLIVFWEMERRWIRSDWLRQQEWGNETDSLPRTSIGPSRHGAQSRRLGWPPIYSKTNSLVTKSYTYSEIPLFYKEERHWEKVSNMKNTKINKIEKIKLEDTELTQGTDKDLRVRTVAVWLQKKRRRRKWLTFRMSQIVCLLIFNIYLY